MSDKAPLAPHLQALLELERRAAGPSAAAQARVLERLEHTLGLTGGPGEDGGGGNGHDGGGGHMSSSSSISATAAPPSASSSGLLAVSTPFALGKVGLGGAALVVAALGLFAGVLVGVLGGERQLLSLSAPAEVAQASARDDGERSGVAATRQEPPAAGDDEASEGADVFVIDEKAIQVRGAGKEAAPSSARQPAKKRSASTLAEEQALLDAARGALASGNVAAAERSLRAHAETFSRGQLAEERSALLVLTLSRAGRPNAAKKAAAAFRKRWPTSLHLATVDAALEGTR